jgi:hypothetical protein
MCHENDVFSTVGKIEHTKLDIGATLSSQLTAKIAGDINFPLYLERSYGHLTVLLFLR